MTLNFAISQIVKQILLLEQILNLDSPIDTSSDMELCSSISRYSYQPSPSVAVHKENGFELARPHHQLSIL